MTGPAAQIGRLWRTVRWLKSEQLLGRLRFRLQRPRPDLGAAPALRASAGPWVMPAAREPSLVGPTRWRLLSEEHDLGDIGWDDPAISLLWRYNQHYFDDLNAEGAAMRHDWQRALMQRWCDATAPGRGTAWAPYPTSLRIVNWLKWFIAGAAPTPAWLHSLAVQARWLTQRLEWHLLGNHLFVNAKALVFAGLYFEGAEADAWLATGMRILERELPEQILDDGGQFERSPMYHALALEDLLDLLNLVAARAQSTSPAHRLAPELRHRCSTMLHWLRCLRHPGGALVRFNDCAEGIAPATDDLERYAAALSITAEPAPAVGSLHLPASGYVRAACGPALVFIDVAPIGPDYLPGHAHADTLSFELSLEGREIIVNRGTSVYGTGQQRQWERGTAAHSTVQIGALDSSEVWSGFRVGRRARPGPVHVVDAAGAIAVDGSHDGYAHLPGGPRHHRQWRIGSTALVVEDRVEPAPPEPAVARFHLAPGLELYPAGKSTWQVHERGVERARIEIMTGGVAVATTTPHSLRFGERVEAATLELALVGGQAAVRFTWLV